MLAYFYMHDMSWGCGLLMGIGWLALWALIVFGVVSLLRDRRSDSPNAGAVCAWTCLHIVVSMTRDGRRTTTTA
jgi:hypothetical protein